MVQEQLNEVRQKIVQACERAGRNPSEVKLIAVSKTKPVSMIEEAIACGQTVFGENKVQELCDKIPQLPANLEWHLIGHLQRNKVKYIVDKVALIHSVDTVRLAKQISQEAVKAGVTVQILLEVNVAREESKFGFMEEEVEEAVREIAAFPNIQIVGLMTIAPFVADPEENRIYFKKLHQLCVDINKKNIDNIRMSELSMGMTGDYEVAIEEGATMVRVGTGIFGTR
ncbi:MAG TPA: YggS family pyridoxal phosphate-dependent enzyme [Candidatus Fimimorpha faecalis]|uniref:Pyridoxal phosphate homeostasis protein n=1 Tax=Candidatus Fimimorpha faecalis TaxID=2840824 RepID=A0A9D1JC72_9FIRM|nr:YggS family pyridoxal phosphate-dependent enzyme [Candidatus Fimimorpha faecalis]